MKILLIDGNSILNRAYFALPSLNTENGTNVNAVYGFINILLRLQADYNPTHIGVAFDEHGKTFRHNLYDQYKANRKGMPDDLAAQMPILKDLLAKMKVTQITKVGVEADDILGTLAKSFGKPTYIVTGDRDLFQLIDDKVTVLLTKKGVTDVEVVTPQFLAENYHLTPSQIVDYKALRGDASDNIPGVKGIGEKTAMSLLEQYSTVDGVYQNISQISGSTCAKLTADKDMCYLSRALATIKTDVNIDCNVEGLIAPTQHSTQVADTFASLRFNSLLKRLQLQDTVTEPPQPQINVTEVSTPTDARQLIPILLKEREIAVFIDNDIRFAVSENVEYIVKTGQSFLEELYFDNAVKLFQPIFEAPISKRVYDGKALAHLLANYGIKLNNVAWDISIMQYLVSYATFKSFNALCENYGVSISATALFSVGEKLKTQLETDKLMSLYTDIELPLSSVLFDMEQEGVKIDVTTLDKLNAQYKTEIENLSAQVYELCGREFNIASPKQLSQVLFEELKLPAAKHTKTGYSTDNDVLQLLKDTHPAIPLIIKIRQISKLNGTYIEGMRQHIKNGVIHTTYNQTLTSTGRLSSSEPNLQNIPVKDELGKDVRKLFVPKYGLLVSADYSQIELRLLAAFSGEKALIDAFVKGEDIHTKVAAQIYQTSEEHINANMRRTAKVVNFGIIYGISEYGMSEAFDIEVPQARRYIQNYYATYPVVKRYLDSSVEQAKELGYVTTMFNRRRQIPEIKSGNRNIRNFGERAAKNMPLQGSAADIIKIAMLRVYDSFAKNGLKSKLIMQIHDELVIDCFPQEKEIVCKILKEEMEKAVTLCVPLTANIAVGGNLDDAK